MRFYLTTSYLLGGFALCFLFYGLAVESDRRELEARYADLEYAYTELRAAASQWREEASMAEAGTSQEAEGAEGTVTARTLAERNNNPCNIKVLALGQWQGQTGSDRFGHAVFSSPEWGVRAAALVLRTYAREHGIHTVKGIVSRFAAGNQPAYVAYLCKRLGVGEDEAIDIIARLPEILRAMMRFESGRDWPEIKAAVAQYDILQKL